MAGKKPNRVSEIEANNTYNTRKIRNDSASKISSEGMEDLLQAAGKVVRNDILANWGIGITLVLGLYFVWPLILTIVCIAFKIYVRKTSAIHLAYDDVDDMNCTAKDYSKIVAAVQSRKVWRVIESSQVKNRKYAAGAGSLNKLKKCKASEKAPFPFTVDVECASFRSRRETLFFLPSMLIVIQGFRVGAVNYSDLDLKVYPKQFIESGSVPSDATVVGRTWKYVNKSGGPDARFNDNKELPVCLYGRIDVRSPQGLDTQIMFSRSAVFGTES